MITDGEPDYVTDQASGPDWDLLLGDSCERMAEIPDSSIGLSVYSPPFASLFTYSPTVRDLGNSASREEFLDHYGYIIRENLRITMPGRIACVHVQQVTTTKVNHGEVGLTDFRGDVIRAYIDEGWIFHGEITVNKDPQAQAIRTKAQALMFVTKNRDSSKTRPALADYLLLFRKPGDNLTPIKNDVSNEEWIDWAQPIWLDHGGADGDHLCPVWLGVRETNTLNVRAGRDTADERHICPLQLDFIERCVRLWSNPGETVFTPFAGIGSEVYVARKLGRRGLGIELKESYWNAAVANLRRLDAEMDAPSLFDDLDTTPDLDATTEATR
jgi:DNA modification methylase